MTIFNGMQCFKCISSSIFPLNQLDLRCKRRVHDKPIPWSRHTGWMGMPIKKTEDATEEQAVEFSKARVVFQTC